MSRLRATYRLQLRRGVDFDTARELVVPYLQALGISDLYLSPPFEAREGSTHGYDVLRPDLLDEALGGREGFERLAAAVREAGLGILLDIVPNHQAAVPENPRWWSLLQHGPASPWAEWFDVDWSCGDPSLEGRVLLPLLAESFEASLQRGELRLALEERGLVLETPAGALPLDPATWTRVLSPLAGGLQDRSEREDRSESEACALQELRKLEGLIESMPPRRTGVRDREAVGTRIELALADLLAAHPVIRASLEDLLARIDSGSRGTSEAPRLRPLLEAQAWRLTGWREGSSRVNYRRFFDIHHLVGVRVEDPRVFEAVHRLPLRLLREGSIAGLRIDHIDGLRRPRAYLARLGEACREAAAGEAWIVVEKILAEGERLPPSWDASGTTGYELLLRSCRLLLDPEGVRRLVRDRRDAGRPEPEELVHDARREAFGTLLQPERDRLVRRLAGLAAQDPAAEGLDTASLEEALIELSACLGVYRTYAEAAPLADDDDRRRFRRALEEARGRSPQAQPALAFLERIFFEPCRRAEIREARSRFVLDWQQVTGAIAAKGIEDTALYRDATLLAVDEVGGRPESGALPPEELIGRSHGRLPRPATLNPLQTHDAKRGADVRARLAVLTELAEEWIAARERWRAWNDAVRDGNGARAPAPREEEFLYQTLLGAWPMERRQEGSFQRRLESYLVKALREAKEHTSWLDPDPDYEEAVLAFLRGILDPSRSPRFLEDFRRLQSRVAFHGACNGLVQVLLQATLPGVPDVYQGSELWDLSLVDPDNRREVDFAHRAARLRRLEEGWRRDPAALCEELLGCWRDGGVKLHLLRRCLAARQGAPGSFRGARPRLLEPSGEPERLLCLGLWPDGEAGCPGGVGAVVLAPLRSAGLPGARVDAWPLGEATWGNADVTLPPGSPPAWRSAVSGVRVEAVDGRLPVAQALQRFPVELLLPGA